MLAGIVVAVVACQDATSPTQALPRTHAVAAVTGKVIPDQYIIVLRDVSGDFHTAVARYAHKAGAKVKFEYGSVLQGFAGEMTAEAAAALAADPGVAYVEPDQEVHITTTQSGATWGIDRIDQRSLPLSGTYVYNSQGTGVRAYIIDTGIETSHPQFGSRASAVYDAFGGNGQDCNGHGTHVAGTVGAATYGVAKNVYLRAVRVLDCNGSGSNSGVIAGLDWVRTNAIKPAVANMSLGGSYSSTMNTA
ncbi:MAG: S8 family serine peptidase, partial [Gemmatimonadaceae bacterium]|nr:S8 family serine peptidase [Gemmatimonadaceae bacterium]